jgi:hypothetical protein
MYIRVWNNDSENGNSLYMVFVPNLWLNKTRQSKKFSRQWCPCCIVNSNIMTHSFPLHFNVFRYIPMVIKISFYFFRIVLLMIQLNWRRRLQFITSLILQKLVANLMKLIYSSTYSIYHYFYTRIGKYVGNKTSAAYQKYINFIKFATSFCKIKLVINWRRRLQFNCCLLHWIICYHFSIFVFFFHFLFVIFPFFWF